MRPRYQTTLSLRLVSILIAIVTAIVTLVNPGPANDVRQASAAAPPLPTNLRMIQIVDKLQASGITIIGSGSWITDRKFRDPLSVGIGVEPSDFDMRIYIGDPKTPPQTMIDTWKQAGDKLRELINEEFKDDPAAAKKMLQSTNLYPPDQLMAGVTNNAEALERSIKYNRVPNLGITSITSNLDPNKAVGGIYGEGSRAQRQFKELTEGRVFGKQAASIEQIIAEEGAEKFTAKGSASVSRQWGEFADYWLKEGEIHRSFGHQSGKGPRSQQAGLFACRPGAEGASCKAQRRRRVERSRVCSIELSAGQGRRRSRHPCQVGRCA
jgi:hypothetical protein